MVTPWFGADNDHGESRKQGLTLVVASIPAIVASGLLHSSVETAFRDARAIAVSTICFGLAVLFCACAGWFCIAVFLALLQRVALLPFVI